MTALDPTPLAPTDDFTGLPVNRINIERVFTTPGVHPYDQVTWERRTVVQKNWKTDEILFEQADVEFPDFWSENASTIVTTKYFRGALGSDQREWSLRQLIDRVVGRYVQAADDYDYITNPADLEIFEHELTFMLLNQVFAFNSPVWFNVGTNSPQQVSACFILAVDDSMESILNWYREEGLIFKGGSGAGLNLSRIRSSKELLRSSGGTASGPVSFMRGADASAGTIKSGGATRRAAKMVVLDVNHPDIVEFVETKAREEDKIRVLRDAGFDMDLGGHDISSVQYQNANNSVRVDDAFMQAVTDGTEYPLIARTDGSVVETVNARELFQKIAEAAWACADPGIQFDDTINAWHTSPETGRINASNPCSEYMHLDNTSCNLASLNLLKFLKGDGTFDVTTFTRVVEFVITAMDISISFADFPTDAIDRNTRAFRQLGIGYANLGALLMAKGIAYDSAAGRAYAAAITSLMTGASYRRSAEIAGVVGPYDGYPVNRDGHIAVMQKHQAAAKTLLTLTRGDDTLTYPVPAYAGAETIEPHAEAAAIAAAAAGEWDLNTRLGIDNGWRNSQASVLAPTGTIGFMMDCDTTGIEPDFSLKKFKKLVGGGALEIINNQVPRALAALGYSPEQAEEISAYVLTNGNVVDAPHLSADHYPVFDTAAGQPRAIEPMGHVNMMAAVQPFLSGAISKTVNLPETATVVDIADIYFHSWRLGLKATAVYRDNCKVGQPLSGTKKDDNKTDTPVEPVITERVVEKIVEVPRRERLGRKRASHTTSFKVGGTEGYMTVGQFEDGRPGEIFIKSSKQGSTLAGIVDALAIAISISLQYGVPLETFVSKFTNMRFEPAGLTDDPEIRMAQSLIDYIFRRLALDYLPRDVREVYGIFSVEERTAMVDAEHGALATSPALEEAPRQDEIGAEADAPTPVAVEVLATPPSGIHEDIQKARAAATADAPDCSVCHSSQFMVRAGACWVCSADGTSTGCS